MRSDGAHWFYVGPWGRAAVGDVVVLYLPFVSYRRIGHARHCYLELFNRLVWERSWGHRG